MPEDLAALFRDEPLSRGELGALVCHMAQLYYVAKEARKLDVSEQTAGLTKALTALDELEANARSSVRSTTSRSGTVAAGRTEVEEQTSADARKCLQKPEIEP